MKINRKKIITDCCFFLFPFTGLFGQAQSPAVSEMQVEMQRQHAMSAYPQKQWDSLRCAWYGECADNATAVTDLIQDVCPLTKRFFGWHVIGGTGSSYVWSSLSDLSYFSYEVNYLDGNAVNNITNWGNSIAVLAAKANEVRVNLAVTFFGNIATFGSFFGNAAAQNTLISNLINEVITAGVSGVNIDFEGAGLSSTYATAFASFLLSLTTQMHAAVPGSEVSVDIQGSHVTSTNYLTQLNASVDLFILMGYDYYWGTQTYPGPVAPTYQFTGAVGDPNGHGNVANDLNTMLRYVPASKVLLAMPYYGRRWRASNGCVLPGIGVAASPGAQTYTQYRDNLNGYYSMPMREANSFTAYHCFNDVNGNFNQQFMDDAYSLQKKYNLIHQRGLAGGAVWKLGNDAGYPDLWALVNNNLSTCAAMPCRDTLYDMGGPNGNYQNNQNYTFSINPPGAAALSLRFLSFDLETNFDSLRIYDGASAAAPLLGEFTGNTLPPVLVATSGIFTLQFHSDAATTKPGFKVIYNCSPQLVRTVASGNWNNPDIWDTGAVPLATDTVIVMPGHQVTVTATSSVKNIEVSTTGAVILIGTAQLNISN